jgi:hypothetical protein
MRVDSWQEFQNLKNRVKGKLPRPRHTAGKMNKTESAYANVLELRKKAGEVKRWVFEPIKFRLADKTYYTPDFMVTFDDHIEFHEVKGFWEDDARVKIKVVAEIFPEFLFLAVKKSKGDYQIEFFNLP